MSNRIWDLATSMYQDVTNFSLYFLTVDDHGEWDGGSHNTK